MAVHQNKPSATADTRRTQTRAKVAFYTWPGNGFSAEEPFGQHPDFGHVVSVQTAKSLGAPSGTFSIVVKKPAGFGARSLDSLWVEPENVWVLVQFLSDNEVYDTMLGLIDSVSDDMSRSGGGMRSETFTITGRDFGKVFETTEIHVDMHGGSLLRTVSSLCRAIPGELIGTPAHFVRFLFDLWIGNNEIEEKQWILPPALATKLNAVDSFYGSVHLAIEAMDAERNGLAIQKTAVSPDQGGTKVWDAMQSVANGVLNELFVDFRPLEKNTGNTGFVPMLVLRERPFPAYVRDAGRRTKSMLTYTAWNQLRERVLEAGDVQSRSLAKGGAAHRFNYWALRPASVQTFALAAQLTKPREGVDFGYPGNVPIVNYDSVRRHGLRRWEQGTDYIPFYQENQRDQQIPEVKERAPDEWLRLLSDWTRKVHDWYCVAPMELSGTITTSRIRPDIHIGERITEIRPGGGHYHYYVEAVSHSWTYPNAGQTSITVTRGEKDTDRLLEKYYEVTRFGTYPVGSLSGDPLVGIDPLTGTVDEEASLEGLISAPDAPRAAFESAGGIMKPRTLSEIQADFPPDNVEASQAGEEASLSQAQLESGAPIVTPGDT